MHNRHSKMKLLLSDFQGTQDTQRVKEFLLGRELWQSLPDYWTTGKSTVGIFHTIFDSPISHHKFWCASSGKYQAYVGLHPAEKQTPSDTIERNPNTWRMFIHPGVKTTEFASDIVDAAEEQLLLLTDQRSTDASIETVAYGSDNWLASLLKSHGYAKHEALDVYMQRSLDDQVEASVLPDGYILRPLDAEKDLDQRAGAQSDAFAGQPEPGEWALENIHRFVTWYQGRDDLDLVAVSATGEIASFAVFLIDPLTGMGELDPVGTRASHQRQGLSKAVLLSGLQYMKSKGMNHACVRTGVDNAAAIRTYESVGFHVVDHLYRYAKSAT